MSIWDLIESPKYILYLAVVLLFRKRDADWSYRHSKKLAFSFSFVIGGVVWSSGSRRQLRREGCITRTDNLIQAADWVLGSNSIGGNL